jgi:NTE family protein
MPESSAPPTPRRGLALGCGGTLGFAWTAIALQAIERQLGWDARTAEVIVGTSAGSEMAALLGSGRSVDSIVAALDGSTADSIVARHLASRPGAAPPLPALSWPALGLVGRAARRDVDLLAAVSGLLPRGRGDAGWLRALGDRLANEDGWLDHPGIWLVAAAADTGERVAFGAPGAPRVGLADAIAASWAVPGWMPPVSLMGRDYLDGGCVSHASADLLVPLGLDEVIIVAPMSTSGGAAARGFSRAERVVRRAMTRRVDRDQAMLEAAGTRVIRVEPGERELAVMGPNFMDPTRRQAAVEAARLHTPSRVRRAIATGAVA